MPRKPLFKAKAEEWIEGKRRKMLSTDTTRNYAVELNLAFRFAKEHDWPMNPKKIGTGEVREYYESLANKSLGTQKEYMHVLIRFLAWCGNKEMEDVDLRIHPARSRVSWLTEEQVALLVSRARSPQMRGALVLFAYTGMRIGEVLMLRAKDVRAREVVVRGKGRKERIIPLTDDFWAEIDPYMEWRERQGRHDLFLLHRHGKVAPYSESGLYGMVIKQGRRYGLHTPPHTFRRSFGRHLYKRGCPLAELSNLMGHASIEQTIEYLGIGSCDLEDAISYVPDYGEIARKLYSGPMSQTA